MKKTTIVIVGGGFAGVRAALDLCKYVAHRPHIRLVLIDQQTYQTYHPSLYEVASMELRSRAVTVPFAEIFAHKKIELIHKPVTELRPKQKQIILGGKDALDYDYCILTLGSVTDDFGIKGISEFAMGMKKILEANDVGQALHQLYRHNLRDQAHSAHLIIGGGGFAGVELAGELATHFKKHPAQRRPKLTLIEAGPKLIGNLPERASASAKKRLEKLGVTVMVATPIKQVDKEEVSLSDRSLIYDVFCWTGGVRANPLVAAAGLRVDRKGRHFVLPTLQSSEYDSLYLAGDCLSFAEAGDDTPMTAQSAMPQGKAAALNIIHRLEEMGETPYAPKNSSFIVPVGKSWAILIDGKFWFSGWIPSIVKRFVELEYLFEVLPPGRALRRWRPEANLMMPD